MPRPAIRDQELAWPIYYAKRDLDARRVQLKAGDLFPLQNKAYIRGLGPSYLVDDADRRPFASLDYVETLNVGSEEMARMIQQQGLKLPEAKRSLRAAK